MGRKILTEDLKERIIKVLETQKSTVREIADRFVVPKSTMQNFIKRYKDRGHIHNIPKSGRPRITTERTDQHIITLAKRDPFITARCVQFLSISF